LQNVGSNCRFLQLICVLFVLPCVCFAQPQLRATGDVAMTGMRESSSQLLSAATLPL
jgi:hypothetical protein